MSGLSVRELNNSNSFVDAAAVTPNDGADLPGGPCQGVYVGGAGTLTVVTKAGTSVLFAAVPAGTTIRLRVRRVMATGTAATSIVALYNRP
jgi:hypothetical protein